jgi:hypothetical protein
MRTATKKTLKLDERRLDYKMGVVIAVVSGFAIIVCFFQWLFDEAKNRDKRYENYHRKVTVFFYDRSLQNYPYRGSAELYREAQVRATKYIEEHYPEMVVRK